MTSGVQLCQVDMISFSLLISKFRISITKSGTKDVFFRELKDPDCSLKTAFKWQQSNTLQSKKGNSKQYLLLWASFETLKFESKLSFSQKFHLREIFITKFKGPILCPEILRLQTAESWMDNSAGKSSNRSGSKSTSTLRMGTLTYCPDPPSRRLKPLCHLCRISMGNIGFLVIIIGKGLSQLKSREQYLYLYKNFHHFPFLNDEV